MQWLCGYGAPICSSTVLPVTKSSPPFHGKTIAFDLAQQFVYIPLEWAVFVDEMFMRNCLLL